MFIHSIAKTKTKNYEIIFAIAKSRNAHKLIKPFIAINTSGLGIELTAWQNMSIRSQVIDSFVIDKTYVFDLNPCKF